MQKYQTYDKQLFVMNFSTNKVLVKTSGSNFCLFDCPVWCNLTHILSYNRSSRQKAHDSRRTCQQRTLILQSILYSQYYSTQYYSRAAVQCSVLQSNVLGAQCCIVRSCGVTVLFCVFTVSLKCKDDIQNPKYAICMHNSTTS